MSIYMQIQYMLYMWTTSLVINMFMLHVQWMIMKKYTPRVVFRQHYFSKHIYKHNSYHKFPNTLFYNVHVSTMQLIFSYAILFMKNMLSKYTYILVLCKYETPLCIVSLNEVIYKERTVEAYEIVLDPSFVSVSITSTSAKICCTIASSSS